MFRPVPITDQNPSFKEAVRLQHEAHFRSKSNAFTLEHSKAILEWLSSHKTNCVSVFCTDSFAQNHLDFEFPKKTYLVTDSMFKKLSRLETPQGLLAVFKKPSYPTELLKKAKKIMVLDRVQNPSNLGALIRSATAFYADAIVVLKGSADPFHPQALQAMAGCLNTPIFSLSLSECDDILGQKPWFYLDPKAKKVLGDTPFPDSFCVVFGSEGQGISDAIKQNPQCTGLKIAHSESVESLNVAVSGGIFWFEATKKR